MTKKYNEFFRKHGKLANAIPEMLTELQESSSLEPTKLYYMNKLNEVKDQKPMTSEKDIEQAIKDMPDDQIAVFFNLQHMNFMKEGDFVALDAYIEMLKKRTMRREFYRGFHHGPAIVCAFTKKQISEKMNGVNMLSGYPTIALYL